MRTEPATIPARGEGGAPRGRRAAGGATGASSDGSAVGARRVNTGSGFFWSSDGRLPSRSASKSELSPNARSHAPASASYAASYAARVRAFLPSVSRYGPRSPRPTRRT